MVFQCQVVFCCAFLLVMGISAHPQVWNIGFNPNSQQNQVIPVSSTTAAPGVQSTTPSRAYYNCLGRCITTSEYNPVCGSDALNYHNLGRLECAARCGTSVTMVRGGTCAGL